MISVLFVLVRVYEVMHDFMTSRGTTSCDVIDMLQVPIMLDIAVNIRSGGCNWKNVQML
jgi:hypothetical protein